MKWATQCHRPSYSAALQLVGVASTTMFDMITNTCHKFFSKAVSHSTLPITDILLNYLYIHVWRLFSPTASIYLAAFILPNFTIHRACLSIQPKTQQCHARSNYWSVVQSPCTWPSSCYWDFALSFVSARGRAVYCHLLGAWPYGHALSDRFGLGCLCLLVWSCAWQDEWTHTKGNKL
jgi:hypothetical protein